MRALSALVLCVGLAACGSDENGGPVECAGADCACMDSACACIEDGDCTQTCSAACSITDGLSSKISMPRSR